LALRSGHADHLPQRRLGQVLGDGLVGADLHARGEFDVERLPDAQHVANIVFFQVGAQIARAAVDFVAGRPARHGGVGDHVTADIDGQFRFRLELHVVADAHRGAALGVVELVFGHIDRSADQGVPARRGIRAVHRVHPVGDLANAAHVLPLRPGGGFPALLLPGLIQRRHPKWLVTQLLDHETPDHALGRGVVPHRMVEQPLRTVRGRIAHILGDLPPILTRHIADQRAHILTRLLKRLHPGETRLQPRMQLRKVGLNAATLYDGSRSRLILIIRHTMIIVGRLPTRSPNTPYPRSRISQVRLPY
jgi:hypothetical protein